MDKIGTSMRSKMPPLGLGNTQNEGTILLSQISSSQHKQNANYNTNANFNINNINNSNQASSNCDEGQHIDTLSQLSSDNDLYDYNDKSNANRINEWQAGYNVTNAIQVRVKTCKRYFVKETMQLSYIYDFEVKSCPKMSIN